jgi:hypothetical protein
MVALWAPILAILYSMGGNIFLSSSLIPFSYAMWFRMRSRRAGPQLMELIDAPSAVRQYPVEVRYRKEEQAYGEDQGVLSFVDGLVSFEGLRSSFTLSKANGSYRGVPIVKQRRHAPEDLLIHRFNWLDGYDEYEVDVIPFEKLKGGSENMRSDFIADVEAWFSHVSPETKYSLLPPKSLMPGFRTEVQRKLVLCAGISVALTAGIASAAFVFHLNLNGNHHGFAHWGLLVLANLTAWYFTWQAAKQLAVLDKMSGANPESKNQLV